MLVLFLALESGFRFGLRQRHSSQSSEKNTRGDVTLSSMLALLGLMLAFTYCTCLYAPNEGRLWNIRVSHPTLQIRLIAPAQSWNRMVVCINNRLKLWIFGWPVWVCGGHSRHPSKSAQTYDSAIGWNCSIALITSPITGILKLHSAAAQLFACLTRQRQLGKILGFAQTW